MKSKKGGLQFGWIFAVIVGAVILFLAFYFVGQLMMEGRIESETVSARSLDIVLMPLSHFGELGAVTAYLLKLPQTSKIELSCELPSSFNPLGSNSILLVAEQKEAGVGIPKKVYDKYLFGENLNKTPKKRFQSLTKSVEMPWRIVDLTMLWPADRNYCFVSAPDRIEQELGDAITGLNISSISFDETDCNGANVCFKPGTNCDVEVSNSQQEGTGIVTKKLPGKPRESLNYAGDALMYAAIFSDSEIYNCNLQRIGKRLELEIEVYEKKAKILTVEGCPTVPLSDFKALVANTDLDFSSKLPQIWLKAKGIKQRNNYAECKLF